MIFSGRDEPPHVIAGHRAGENAVGLAGMPDRLVRQDAGDRGVEDDVVHAGLAARALGLLAQSRVERVDPCQHRVEIEELVLDVAEPAQHVVQLDKTIIRLNRQVYQERSARNVGIGRCAFGGHERLLDRKAREGHVAVDEPGIFRGDSRIYPPQDIDALTRRQARPRRSIIVATCARHGLRQDRLRFACLALEQCGIASRLGEGPGDGSDVVTG